LPCPRRQPLPSAAPAPFGLVGRRLRVRPAAPR
jgi:hypothetical protein